MLEDNKASSRSYSGIKTHYYTTQVVWEPITKINQ